MQCYMYVAEQLAVKEFLHLNFGSIVKNHYKVLEMNISTASSNLFCKFP